MKSPDLLAGAAYALFALGLAATAIGVTPRPAAAEQAPPGTQPATQPAGTPGEAGEEATKPKLVTNIFYETSLRQALADIATQVGVIIVPDVTVRGIVTCELKDVPVEKALEIVLAGTGFVVKRTPDYYLVCSASLESPSFPLISETRVVKLNYVKAAAAAKLFSPSFRDYVRTDDETNAVCITAPAALAERLAKDVKLIDQPPEHVMLEARIVVLERTDLLNMGIQWNWPVIQMGAFSDDEHHGGSKLQPDWPWGIRIGYTPGREFTNSLVLTLNLLGQNDEATVIANPQVMAQDGKEAEIKVSTEEYFEIVTEGYYTHSQLEKIETGTILKITPRIGEAGDITLQMATEVSDVVARGEANLPVVTRRTAGSTVRIEDGGTAVVAGLMDRRSTVNKVWVPGVGKLPVVGALFRNDASKGASRQVAVFVTASLIGRSRPRLQKPGDGRAAIEPVEEAEFKKALRESLQRLKGEQQS